MIIRNRYKIGKKLGSGSFGVVYAGVDIQTGEDVAIKFENRLARRSYLHMEAKILDKM